LLEKAVSVQRYSSPCCRMLYDSRGQRQYLEKAVNVETGKYELRPTVKELYRLGPKVTASSVSVAFQFVNPKHDELRSAVSKELYQLHRKTWVYKMSNNWKVLTVLLYVTLYTILRTHTELLNDIDNTVVISCYCLMFKSY